MNLEMVDLEEEIDLKTERTQSGLPALWEQGGGLSNTGRSVIITGPKGSAKKPIYIRRKGSLACGEHALFTIKPGDCIIVVHRRRKHFRVEVYRIANIDDSDQIEAELLFKEEDGEWFDCRTGKIIPECPFFAAAVKAAKEKAQCYHCREPHYYSAMY